MSQDLHFSVLLNESLDGLAIKPGGIYVDGTFGRGGHSGELLKQLSDQGHLYAFDKDLTAIAHARQNFAGEGRLTLTHASFTQMRSLLEEQDLVGKVDGILLDLGVSSPQLDEAERGFSFLRDGPLDMRMDTSRGETAADFVNNAEQYDIKRVLQVYGEENFAGLIAKKIVDRRQERPFTTTLDLAGFIEAIVPKKGKQKKHPATRSFQAIRIHVNRELEDLENLLDDVVELLAVGGRLVVISFHSLEDRRVKQFIREQERGPQLPRNLPVMDHQIKRDPHLKSVGKAIKASASELDDNVRSRSAVMRIAEKVAA